MKSFGMPDDHRHYPVRLIIEDAFILLTPSILMLIGILWVYRKEWVPVGLENLLASFLPFY
jgi:hypothetical protein